MTHRDCRVFISHSAHAVDEPATLAFLHALTAALQATPGLEPLTDHKDLQAGDEWLQRLYAWMALCDAAVVLLSPRAVTRENSTWVPREANLLLWRKALDTRFVVIPVLIGGLTRADLTGNPFLADVRLTDLQLAPELPEADKVSAIVQALRNKLALAAPRLSFDPLRVHVQDCIQRDAPETSIDAVLSQHYGADPWQPLVPRHQKLSWQMVRQAVSAAVDPVIQDVTLGSQGHRQLGAQLFEALYPLRLPAECAARLLTLCRQQEGRGAVLVNTQDTWAVQQLLRAATGLPRDDWLRIWHVVELNDAWGDDDLSEITVALAIELAGAVLGTDAWDKLSRLSDPAQRLAQQLSRLKAQLSLARAETGVPVIVSAAYTERWAALAAPLAQQFPSTVLLYWTGDALPATLPAGADCLRLTPTWEPGLDFSWSLDYRRKRTQFGGTSP